MRTQIRVARAWLNTVGLPIFGFGGATTTSVLLGSGCFSALGFLVATVFSMCVIGLEFNLKFSSCVLTLSDHVVPIHTLVARTTDPVYRAEVNSSVSMVFHALCRALADSMAECQFFGDLAGARVIECVHASILLVFLPFGTQFPDLGGLFFLGANVAD